MIKFIINSQVNADGIKKINLIPLKNIVHLKIEGLQVSFHLINNEVIIFDCENAEAVENILNMFNEDYI